MFNHLGECVTSARLALGLGRGELARRMGLKNTNKDLRRLIALEREGVIEEEFLERLIAALCLDRKMVEEAISRMRSEQREEYQKWLDEPEPVILHMRGPGGIPILFSPPEHLLAEEVLIAWASETLRGYKHEGKLHLSRRETVWFDRCGEVIGRKRIGPNESPPDFMRPKGSGLFFGFKVGEGGLKVVKV